MGRRIRHDHANHARMHGVYVMVNQCGCGQAPTDGGVSMLFGFGVGARVQLILLCFVGGFCPQYEGSAYVIAAA